MKTFNLLKISSSSLLLVTALLTTTCKKEEEEKQPSADFTFSKAIYVAGETIELINTSINSDTYRWTFPNGTTSKTKDLSHITSETQGNSTLTFKLEAFSKSGNKFDFAVKEVPISPAKGSIVLYDLGALSDLTTEIKIDAESLGSIKIPGTTTIPNCGQSGFPTFDVIVGTHVLTVGGFWAKSFEIKKGVCTKFDILN